MLHTPPIDKQDIFEALAKMRAQSAIGADLWAVDELRALPDCALEALANVYNVLEQDAQGKWPTEMLEAFVALIPKEDGAVEVQSQRPILWRPC